MAQTVKMAERTQETGCPIRRFGAFGLVVSVLLVGSLTASVRGGANRIGETERVEEQEPAGQRPPATLALLVGINDYAGDPEQRPFDSLQGPENDVERARAILVEQFGFDPAGIEVLIGPAATHQAIVTKFYEHLIRRAGAETRVVFWFSGHGSRIPDASDFDPSARDNDGVAWDDTLVAYDSRAVAADGSYDLVDDELFTLLHALRARDVVFVTDCCHSGGLLRGEGSGRLGVRDAGFGSAPLDTARIGAFWPKDLPTPSEDDGRVVDLEHVVHVAACSATEQAGEIEIAKGVFYGTCTWFLGEALRAAGPATTWAEVVERARVSAFGQGTRGWQRVRMVGDERRLVLGGRGRPAPAGFVCELHGGKKSLTVAAGSIHGIGSGARLRLVDYDGKEVGAAIVDEVRVTSCKATWQGQRAMPRTIARAQPETFGEAAPDFLLRLADGVAPEPFTRMEFVATTAGDDADYEVERRGERLALLDHAGRAVREFETEPAAIESALLRERYWRSLWQCAAVPGSFPLWLRIEPATADEAASLRRPIPPAERLQLDGDGERTVGGVAGVHDYEAGPESGSLIKVQIENRASQPLHIALLSVTESREIQVLVGSSEQNTVAPGKSITKLVWIGRSAQWPRERAMVDRYIAIATPRAADFKPFEEEIPTRTRGDSTGVGMPPFLREAFGAGRTRGGSGGGSIEEQPWGITSVDLRLVAPEVFDRLQRD